MELTNEVISRQKQKASGDWVIFSARMRREKLNTLNYKLDQEGFKTVGEFLNAWVDGNWPKHTNNEQVGKLIERLREKGITNPLTGEVTPTFYRGIDREDMLRSYLRKYKYDKHARDLVRYYERFVDIFFYQTRAHRVGVRTQESMDMRRDEKVRGIL